MVEMKHGVFGSIGKTESKPEQPEQPAKPTAKTDLRSLVELGCIRDNVSIGDMTFTLRSLNSSERMAAMNMVGEEDLKPQQLFDFNVLILSMAVETVNGVPLEQVFLNGGGDPNVDPVEAKKAIVANMQHSVIARLIQSYNSITERADAQFTAEQVKN